MSEEGIDALLYRMGQEQRENDLEAVDGFGCSYDDAELVDRLYGRGLIFLPRRDDLLDGVIFHGIALTKTGVRKWRQLQRMRADP